MRTQRRPWLNEPMVRTSERDRREYLRRKASEARAKFEQPAPVRRAEP